MYSSGSIEDVESRMRSDVRFASVYTSDSFDRTDRHSFTYLANSDFARSALKFLIVQGALQPKSYNGS